MNIKTKTLIFLIILCIIDMLIPIPILGVILISVVFQKPLWFRDVVSEIYKS
jgi:hypothetical protein